MVPLTRLYRSAVHLVALALLVPALAGCAGSTSEAGEPPAGVVSEVQLNSIVLGEPSPNVLKGMIVAADPARSRLFVHGIKTENLAVLDLATGTRQAIIEIPGALDGVRLAVDGRDGKVWVAKADGTRMWKVDGATQTIEIERDLSGDTLPGAANWTLRDIMVLPGSGDVLTVRADGDRVVRYDDQGRKTGELFAGQSIFDVDWAAATGELCLLRSPSQGNGEILLAHPQTGVVTATLDVGADGGRPPVHLDCLDDGTFLTAGLSLTRWDAQGATLWQQGMPPHTEAFAESDGTIGLVVRYGATPGPTQQYGMLQRRRLTDGGVIGTETLRFEPSRLVAIGGGDFAVGNGGDASVSIVQGSAVQTVKVGSSAEGVLFDQAGERLLVLNRLGGSQLVDVDLTSGDGSVHLAGDWPVGFALNPRDRRLFVLSHFESAIHVLNLDTLAETGIIDLGLDGSMTDSLAELAAGDEGTLLAASIAEFGTVVVVDGVTEQVLATRALTGPQEGAGPGRLRAAVDEVNRRVFVHEAATGQLFRLEGSDFTVTGQTTVPLERGGRGSTYPYALHTTFYDAEGQRLFIGDKIVDPDTLAVTGQLSGVHRIIAAREGLLWGQFRDSSTTEEWLVVFDAHSLAEMDRTWLGTGVLGSEVGFDWTNRRIAFAMPAESTIAIIDLPKVQAEVPLLSSVCLCGLALTAGGMFVEV